MQKSTRKYTRTKKQEEYVDAILKIKPKAYKRKVPLIQNIISRTDYMNNCIFWVNEFHANRCDKVKAISALACLRKYCDEIIGELNKQP